MELKIVIVLFCALFTGGHSLECYQCLGEMGSCERTKATTCVETATCGSQTIVITTGDTEQKSLSNGCKVKESCVNAFYNDGVSRIVISTKCCNTDLCNRNDAPDYGSDSPNGKICYYCDEKNCFNKLKCLGDEDYCFTGNKTVGTVSRTHKGCISKYFCDYASQVNADYKDVSCCQGNLCNGAKSVTQNLLFLLWPLFFYILIH